MTRLAIPAVLCAGLLASAGCDHNTRTADNTTQTPPAATKGFDPVLYQAAGDANRSRVEREIARGADVNAPNPGNGQTALHAASAAGHKKLVAYLLTQGANVNAKDNSGNTPLHLAAAAGHEDTVRALLAMTPDLTIRNSNGKTAREVASPLVAYLFPQSGT